MARKKFEYVVERYGTRYGDVGSATTRAAGLRMARAALRKARCGTEIVVVKVPIAPSGARRYYDVNDPKRAVYKQIFHSEKKCKRRR